MCEIDSDCDGRRDNRDGDKGSDKGSSIGFEALGNESAKVFRRRCIGNKVVYSRGPGCTPRSCTRSGAIFPFSGLL